MDYTYVGCFKDSRNRALSGPMTAGTDINNNVCIARCAQKVMTPMSIREQIQIPFHISEIAYYSKIFSNFQGFMYAGTQYSRECYCGNTYDKHGPADNCNSPCASDTSQTCGGSWALTVYDTGKRSIGLQ